MPELNVILDYVKSAAIATVGQVIALFGLLFVFGFLLYILARATRTTFVKTIGQKFDIYFTGWIGVPVHEMGHAVFCFVFRHHIDDMKLFSPDPKTGTLGYVNHSYDKSSLYQRIGNFFIGIGPIILGAITLYAILYWLVPNHEDAIDVINTRTLTLDDISSVVALGDMLAYLIEAGRNTLAALFTADNFSDPLFWVFLYVSMCVASHMELSVPDLKGMASGAVTLLVAL